MIYTTQFLPKFVACNVLTTWVVLCKSSTQVTYVFIGKLLGELCAWFTTQLTRLSCKQLNSVVNRLHATVFGKRCVVWIGLYQYGIIALFCRCWSSIFASNSKWNKSAVGEIYDGRHFHWNGMKYLGRRLKWQTVCHKLINNSLTYNPLMSYTDLLVYSG
jgi:hypothetical protein